jgi:hypothetical protein
MSKFLFLEAQNFHSNSKIYLNQSKFYNLIFSKIFFILAQTSFRSRASLHSHPGLLFLWAAIFPRPTRPTCYSPPSSSQLSPQPVFGRSCCRVSPCPAPFPCHTKLRQATSCPPRNACPTASPSRPP